MYLVGWYSIRDNRQEAAQAGRQGVTESADNSTATIACKRTCAAAIGSQSDGSAGEGSERQRRLATNAAPAFASHRAVPKHAAFPFVGFQPLNSGGSSGTSKVSVVWFRLDASCVLCWPGPSHEELPVRPRLRTDTATVHTRHTAVSFTCNNGSHGTSMGQINYFLRTDDRCLPPLCPQGSRLFSR